MTSVAVVGAGVIGLSAAWELASAGCQVEVFDDAPASGASFAAAGMLAPVSETVSGEDEVLQFGLRSLSLWPQFAARLEQASGAEVGLRPEGTLIVAGDADDARELRHFTTRLAAQGLSTQVLTSRQLRTAEPSLSPRLAAGLSVPGDHSVDNRALTSALLRASAASGVQLHRERVGVLTANGRAVGVRGMHTGTIWQADMVLVAAGAASACVDGVRIARVPAVRPVKGQILRLRGEPGAVTHTVRAIVGGRSVYLVPRSDGGLVVGATCEDIGPDTRVTAGAVHDLLRRAIAVVPEVSEYELVETTARLRPATADNAPVVGETGVPGLLLATGHYRGGVLMAPATAAAVTDLVLGRPPSPLLRSLSPLRFDTTVQGASS
jgi:glycine oxidase